MQQFEIMRRLLDLDLDLYGYVTLTSPYDEGVDAGVADLVDRLQELDANLPLRVVPLQIRIFTPVSARVADHADRERSLVIQEQAIAAWNFEIEKRFDLRFVRCPFQWCRSASGGAHNAIAGSTRSRCIPSSHRDSVFDGCRVTAGFHKLIASLPGVYPTTALEAAERLASSGRINTKVLADLRRDAACGVPGTPTRSILPLPTLSILSGGLLPKARGSCWISPVISHRGPRPYCFSAPRGWRSKPSLCRSTTHCTSLAKTMP